MFSDELHIFFQYLGRKILSEVDLKNPLESVFYGHVTDTINKYWVEYDKILSHYVDKAAIIGNVHYEILLNASKGRAEHFQATKAKNNPRQFLDNELATSDNNELFAPNPKVSSRLKRKKFEASEKTRARVDKEINNILGEAYREGWGPRYVGDKIRQRFTDLSTYEARRIAQTEINTTRNYVQYQRMQDDEMEYKIWHAAHDSRTRKSHLKVDEEIVPINERFSNGLMYPGDKDGPIEEWVNCRCSHAAYIMPLGYEAPDFFPFTESDLVKVGSSLSQDYVSEIQDRIRLIDGAMVRQQQEERIEKPSIVELVEEFTNPANISKEEAQEILHFKKRRDKNKIEYGNLIETETGKKIYDEDIRGKKGQITIPRPSGKNYSLIHNHPSHKPFSGGDIKNFVGYSNEVRCIATNPNGAYVATPTKQLKWSKENGSLYESNTAYELMYKVDRIHREAQIELYENKWKAKMQNAKSRKEFNQLKQEWQEESAELIHERILEEFGPGKNEYVEIHFYTNEELEHVIKNSN